MMIVQQEDALMVKKQETLMQRQCRKTYPAKVMQKTHVRWWEILRRNDLYLKKNKMQAFA